MEQLLNDNEKLVFYTYYKNKDKLYECYEDDYISEGYQGLWYASKTFDSSRNIQFSTYAYRCILNRMYQLHRKIRKRYLLEVSGNEPIMSIDGNNIALFDTLSEDDFVNSMCETDSIDDVFKSLEVAIITKLKPKEVSSVILMLQGNNQSEIGKIIDTSQVHVSRLLRRSYNKIRNIYESKKFINYDCLSRSSYIDFDDYLNDLIRKVNNGSN